MVPVRVDSIWIDCRNESLRSGEMCVRGECRLRGHRGASADVVGTANGSNTPLVYLEGLQTTFVDDNNVVSGNKPAKPRHFCTRIIWKPDLELMDQEQILRHCIHDRPPQGHDAVEGHRDMTLAIMAFVEEVTDLEGAFFIHIGHNLLKVLNGEIDPVEVIFQHGLAEQYYGDVLASKYHSHAASTYLDLLCFKNPSMKILEVGAGTGRQTLPLLETMSGDGVKKWERYDYTDISPAFLSQATSYDLVVASHVLHATDILHESLTNIRKLLMPSGKLFLFETTKPDALIAFAFGLLKGWWSPLDHEERSLHSPCLLEETQNRFSSIMVATSIAPVANIHTTLCTSPEVAIIMDGGSKTQNMIADAMLAAFGSVIQEHKIPGLMQSNGKTFDLVVSLPEADSVFLDGISEPDYMNLRSTLVQNKHVLWVMRNPTSSRAEPSHALADGLCRVLMSEDLNNKFATLYLDGWDCKAQKTSELVTLLGKRILEKPVDDTETKYISADNMLQISRVCENCTMNHTIADNIVARYRRNVQVSATPGLKIRINRHGQVAIMGWVESEEEWSKLPLQDDEVLVQVKAIGLMDRDFIW
ncbi:lovastatin nonaketide synthase [Metarhizium brunneum]